MLWRTTNTQRAVITAMTSLALLLTACTDNGNQTAPTPNPATQTSPAAASVTDEPATTTTPAAPTQLTDMSEVIDMSDLTAVNPQPYTGQALGTHFSASDNSIGCKFTAAQGTCYLTDPPAWRPDDWCAVNKNTPVTDSNLIGWGNPPAPYSQAPQHCAKQGALGAGPDYAAASAPLEYGQKITILLSFKDDTTVTCGSRASGLTCILEPSAEHGFRVSPTDYLTW